MNRLEQLDRQTSETIIRALAVGPVKLLLGAIGEERVTLETSTNVPHSSDPHVRTQKGRMVTKSHMNT